MEFIVFCLTFLEKEREMNSSLINPYVRVALRSILQPHLEIKRRIIYDYELIYVEKGEFIFLYNDVTYTCQAGDILLISPGVPHSFHVADEPLWQPHLHFDITHRPDSEKIPVSFKDRCEMSDAEKALISEDYFEGLSDTPLKKVSDRHLFCELFYKTVDETDKLAQKGLLIQLLSLLIRENFPYFFERKFDASVSRQIKDFIDSGQGYAMSLSDFEAMFFYDKFYLEKSFTAKYGVSLVKYRNWKRMEAARLLLATKSVSEVAEALGYGSIYAFSRAYKTHFGHSPTASIDRV